MPKVVCRHCYHPEEVHNVNGTGECGCGCVRLVPIDREARERRKRTWLVEVRMFVKNRWIESGQLRVKAGSAAGAAAVAVRQARREQLKPRTRVGQVSLTITPVPRSAA
jgi:hypothetical protein